MYSAVLAGSRSSVEAASSGLLVDSGSGNGRAEKGHHEDHTDEDLGGAEGSAAGERHKCGRRGGEGADT